MIMASEPGPSISEDLTLGGKLDMYLFDPNEAQFRDLTLAPSFFPVDPMDEEFFGEAVKLEKVSRIVMHLTSLFY
jgi:hypothetical protein